MAQRRDLLDAADRALRRLSHTATMAQIAAEAGITKPVLYRHFGDRDGLFRALASRHVDSLLPALRSALAQPAPVVDRLVATVTAYLDFVAADPEVYRFLVSGEGAQVDSPVATFTARFTAELERGLRVVPGFGPDDPRPTLWAPALVAMVRAAGEAWLAADAQQDRHEVAVLLAELIGGGLTARPRRGQTTRP